MNVTGSVLSDSDEDVHIGCALSTDDLATNLTRGIADNGDAASVYANTLSMQRAASFGSSVALDLYCDSGGDAHFEHLSFTALKLDSIVTD